MKMTTGLFILAVAPTAVQTSFPFLLLFYFVCGMSCLSIRPLVPSRSRSRSTLLMTISCLTQQSGAD